MMLPAIQLFTEQPPFLFAAFIRVYLKFPALGKNVTKLFIFKMFVVKFAP
jgi:hypothetical protein